MTALHAELPAASYARMVTTLVPVNKGTVALHEVVPDAVPESPPDVVHLTLATATLSAAVPPNARLDAVVETIVEPGVVICSVGGAVSPPAGGDVGGGGDGGGGLGAGGGFGTDGGGAGVVVAGAGYRA